MLCCFVVVLMCCFVVMLNKLSAKIVRLSELATSWVSGLMDTAVYPSVLPTSFAKTHTSASRCQGLTIDSAFDIWQKAAKTLHLRSKLFRAGCNSRSAVQSASLTAGHDSVRFRNRQYSLDGRRADSRFFALICAHNSKEFIIFRKND